MVENTIKWNLGRIKTAMAEFRSLFQETTDPQERKLVKRKGNLKSSNLTNYIVLIILFEILNHPVDILADEHINDDFIALLTLCQQKSKIKMKNTDRMFPGIILLAFHENEFSSEWAKQVGQSLFLFNTFSS